MTDLEKQAALTAILSDPDILRAHAPALARRVAAGIMQVPGAVVLGDTDGMMVFYPEGNGSYDSHYLFPQWSRGRDLLRAARRLVSAMFTDHGAVTIRGETPVGNLPARRINRALGAVPAGECVNCEGQRCIRYVLTREAFERSMALCSSSSPSSAAATPSS
jgi:hypothetical protein